MITFFLEWTPYHENDVVAAFQIQLKSGTTKVPLQKKLATEFPDNYLGSNGFSNYTDILWVRFWAKSMRDTQGINEKIRGLEEVKELTFRFGFQVYHFDCWLDSFTI